MVDDTFISFRYSKNLAEGLGPVYNAGERVEGVTNFLWVALLAIPSALGWDLGATARILGLLSTLLGFGLLTIRNPWLSNDYGRLWAGTLFASSAPVACWATGGLETPLFALLILAAVLRVFHEETRSGSGWLSGILLDIRTTPRLGSDTPIPIRCVDLLPNRVDGSAIIRQPLRDHRQPVLRTVSGIYRTDHRPLDHRNRSIHSGIGFGADG